MLDYNLFFNVKEWAVSKFMLLCLTALVGYLKRCHKSTLWCLLLSVWINRSTRVHFYIIGHRWNLSWDQICNRQESVTHPQLWVRVENVTLATFTRCFWRFHSCQIVALPMRWDHLWQICEKGTSPLTTHRHTQAHTSTNTKGLLWFVVFSDGLTCRDVGLYDWGSIHCLWKTKGGWCDVMSRRHANEWKKSYKPAYNIF